MTSASYAIGLILLLSFVPRGQAGGGDVPHGVDDGPHIDGKASSSGEHMGLLVTKNQQWMLLQKVSSIEHAIMQLAHGGNHSLNDFTEALNTFGSHIESFKLGKSSLVIENNSLKKEANTLVKIAKELAICIYENDAKAVGLHKETNGEMESLKEKFYSSLKHLAQLVTKNPNPPVTQQAIAEGVQASEAAINEQYLRDFYKQIGSENGGETFNEEQHYIFPAMVLLTQATSVVEKIDALVIAKHELYDGAQAWNSFKRPILALSAVAKLGKSHMAKTEIDVLVKEAEKVKTIIETLVENIGLMKNGEIHQTDELSIESAGLKVNRGMKSLLQHVGPLAVQLWKEDLVWDSVSDLRETMSRRKKAEEKSQRNIADMHYLNEDTTIRVYNTFARKLDHLGAGPRRNMYGEIDLADIERKITEMEKNKEMSLTKMNSAKGGEAKNLSTDSSLDVEFWISIRQLLHDYYELGLPLKNEIKIRKSRWGFDVHVLVSVGQIEYDFTNRARRRKIKDDMDDFILECSMVKAIPIDRTGLVSVEKADKIFFQMIQDGWGALNGSRWGPKPAPYYGTKFAWNFLFHLLDEHSPKEDQMPAYWAHLDRTDLIIMSPEGKGNLEMDPYNCQLQPFEVYLHMDTTGLDHGKQMLLFPPIINYIPSRPEGTYVNESQLLDKFVNQEQTEEEIVANKLQRNSGIMQVFTAKLTVHVCEKDGKKTIPLHLLQVFDQRRIKMHLQPATRGSGAQEKYKPLLESVDLAKNRDFFVKVAPAGAEEKEEEV